MNDKDLFDNLRSNLATKEDIRKLTEMINHISDKLEEYEEIENLPDGYLSINSAAEKYDLSRSKIYRYTKEKKLPYIRTLGDKIRIKESDLFINYPIR